MTLVPLHHALPIWGPAPRELERLLDFDWHVYRTIGIQHGCVFRAARDVRSYARSYVRSYVPILVMRNSAKDWSLSISDEFAEIMETRLRDVGLHARADIVMYARFS